MERDRSGVEKGAVDSYLLGINRNINSNPMGSDMTAAVSTQNLSSRERDTLSSGKSPKPAPVMPREPKDAVSHFDKWLE